MRNIKIRRYAAENAVFLWQIADALGITDGNFSRRLRHELPDDEQARILQIIDQIVAMREEEKRCL